MIQNGFKSLALVLVVLGLYSCENEINLNAPYKETGVIYGILDKDLDTQVVRIQKAFLGEGNALVMAENADSVYYADGVLDVKMYQLNASNLIIDSFPMTRFLGPPKDQGTFPASPNILYKNNGQTLDPNSKYKIVVRNFNTGNVFSSQTPIVNDVIIERPTASVNQLIRFTGPNPLEVIYTTISSGYIYNLAIRFHYTEEDINSGVIDSSYIDWFFPNEVVVISQIDGLPVKPRIEMEIAGDKFYKFVGSQIAVNPNVIRRPGKLDFKVTVGAEFLANYVDINAPGTNLLTSPPQYSNVDNGLGIFSSRSFTILPNKELDQQSKAELVSGPYTGNLGFQLQ
jgi:hypothetical protein